MPRVTRPFTVEIKRNKFVRPKTPADAAPIVPTLESLLRKESTQEARLSAVEPEFSAARIAAESVFGGSQVVKQPTPVFQPAEKPAAAEPHGREPSGRVLDDLSVGNPLERLLLARAAGMAKRGRPRRKLPADEAEFGTEKRTAPVRNVEPEGAVKTPADTRDDRKPVGSSRSTASVTLEIAPVAQPVPSNLPTQANPSERQFRRTFRRAQTGKELPRGQRWRRRLPKVCW